MTTRWQYELIIPHPLPSFCSQFSVPCLSLFVLQVSACHFSFLSLFAIFTRIQMRGQPAGWECHAVLTEGLQLKNGASWLSWLLCLVTRHQGQYTCWGCCGVWSDLARVCSSWAGASSVESYQEEPSWGQFSHRCRLAFGAFRSYAMFSVRIWILFLPIQTKHINSQNYTQWHFRNWSQICS